MSVVGDRELEPLTSAMICKRFVKEDSQGVGTGCCVGVLHDSLLLFERLPLQTSAQALLSSLFFSSVYPPMNLVLLWVRETDQE
jgi:hypothetical protein